MSEKIKDELRKLIGKPCFFKEGTLYIRKKSDLKIVGIEDDYIITEHFLSGRAKNPVSVISRIERHDLESSDNPIDKSLHDGAKEGNIEMVEKAVKNGADINSKNDSRSTALMTASMKG